jgi:hypothetical protein
MYRSDQRVSYCVHPVWQPAINVDEDARVTCSSHSSEAVSVQIETIKLRF